MVQRMFFSPPHLNATAHLEFGLLSSHNVVIFFLTLRVGVEFTFFVIVSILCVLCVGVWERIGSSKIRCSTGC